MDKKKIPIAHPAPWSPDEEQQFFGNQAPFASAGDIASQVDPSLPPTEPGPSHPQQHFSHDHIPQDAPPMYSEQPMRIPSAPQVYPDQPVARPPQPGFAPHPHPQPHYGAIPPNPQYSPSHHRYRPIQQDEDDSSDEERERRARRKHRRKKRKSKCGKCCCWTIILILLFTWFPSIAIFSDDACSIADNSNGKTFDPVSVQPSSSLDFRLEIDEKILGKVVVMESPDWMQPDIQILLRLQGSRQRVLDAVSIAPITNKTAHTAAISVHLNTRNQRGKEQMLKGECLKAFVEIIYPRAHPGTGSLDIVTTAGTIKVKLNNNLAVFRTIALTSTLGDISLDGVHVQKKTSVRTSKGNVSGLVKTTGQVNVEVEKGTINLSVDDAPDIHGVDPSTLDVKLSTGYGAIDLKQVRRFQGHFSLTAIVGRLEFRKSSRYGDQVHYTSNTMRQLEGWISKGGEPVSLLPRIELKTTVGDVKAIIQDPPSKG